METSLSTAHTTCWPERAEAFKLARLVCPKICKVALDTPLRRLFDYCIKVNQAIPETLARPPEPGMRVLVPFGRQKLVGIVVELAANSELPDEKLRPVLEVLDTTPLLDAPLLEFLRWAADYYHHPVGQVIATALPKLLREGRDPREKARGKRATAQGVTAPAAHRGSAEPLALGVAQQAALDAITAHLNSPGAFLLDGVTGSGKTEVYLRIVEAVLARGGGALVLCPEIGLTPQLVERFRARFDLPIASLHSQLTDRERMRAWHSAASGAARIVIGTRSAVFTPVPALGVIIVDEEHDASYKQQDGGFRYSARDLAVLRAQRLGIPAVLGSATPSFESLRNVALGKFTRLALPARAGAAVEPRVSLIDLRAQAVHRGIAVPLLLAMDKHLADGGQVLLYLNRRGYAPTLLCTGCGWIAPCRSCDARMTVHQRSGRLACHHCGADEPLPKRCPRCGYPVQSLGHGTERVEETLAERFPGVAIERFDRDVLRAAGSLEAAIERVKSGDARILVGTQMLTKGHHFPDVTLVGVLNADQSLFSTDFRAGERLAQTLVQVAGRAGRADRPGEVLIQSQYPDHPLLQVLLNEGYAAFAARALPEREDAQWPPFGRLALVRASSTKPEGALEFLRAAAAMATDNGSAALPRFVHLRGPGPAAMLRRAGRYHAQLLIESAHRAPLQTFLEDWLPKVEALRMPSGLRWSLDVDPLEVF
ncbi:MAG: primosomal protein N' [Nevskiaceae bacterium]|nr:primosomal protein N' [Nevskiaceae bacterium]